MFVETKKDGEAPTKTELSLVGFMEWLEQQPADEAYVFEDAARCAAGRYYTSLGLTPKQWIAGPHDSIGHDLDVPEYALLQVLDDEPHTFGAVLERLRAL
jgi:hypothetical protein